MKTLTDNGYISNYLIHWTGRDDDKYGTNTLSKIASTCRLKLSYNKIHVFDCYNEVHEKMVCFTDVPLRHSSEHCKRYGRFGIGFHKLKLMNVGAQPVFYVSHVYKRDMNKIFQFLQKHEQQKTLPPEVFQALSRHFYFMQQLSDGRADGNGTFYYEREWRLGEQTLIPDEKLDRSNSRYYSQQEGYPAYTGRLVTEGDETYFEFTAQDVAFLIVPKSFSAKVWNPHELPIETYEDLVYEEE